MSSTRTRKGLIMKQLTLIVLCVVLAACQPHTPKHISHIADPAKHDVVQLQPLDNGSYAYQRQNNNGDWIWYYLWLSSMNNSQYHYWYGMGYGSYGGVSSSYASVYSPTQMGRSISTAAKPLEAEVDKEGKVETNEPVEEIGTIEGVDAKAVEAVTTENAQIDRENETAVENFENEGGVVAPAEEETSQPAQEAPTESTSESSSSESSSSDSGSSSGDGGGSSGGD